MKGIVFTEFLEMVEDKFSPEVADRIIEDSALPTCGAYAATGTYDASELVSLVANLSTRSDVPVPDLLLAYGRGLFGRFRELYGGFFEGVETAFQFLASVEHYIHIEVRKLYPEAELPRFEYEEQSADRMVMIYRSERPFAMFAEGLIRGCVEHFGEAIEISHEDLSGGQGTEARFVLTRTAAA